MALTGKTIAELTYLSGATSNTLFPVELNGNTYHVPFSGMTGNSSPSFVSGIVNAGTYVELGTLRVRLPQTGNRSIQVAAVTGNVYVVIGSSVYSQNGVAGSTISNASPVTITTTPTYLNSNYNFLTAGSTDTWVIMDEGVKIAWRITYMIGVGYNNNLITIERLY